MTDPAEIVRVTTNLRTLYCSQHDSGELCPACEAIGLILDLASHQLAQGLTVRTREPVLPAGREG